MDCWCDPHKTAWEGKNKDSFFQKSMPVTQASPLWWGQQGAGTRALSSVSQEPQVQGHSCSPPGHQEQQMMFSQDGTKEFYWHCIAWKSIFVCSCDAERCRVVPPHTPLLVCDTTRRVKSERAEHCCLPEERKPTVPALKYHTSVVKVFSRLFRQFSWLQVMPFLGQFGEPGAC